MKDKRSTNTNQKKITTTSKQTQLIAVAILAASIVAAAAMTGGISNGQNPQKAMAQEVNTPQTGAAAAEANESKTAVSNGSSSSSMAATTVKAVDPSKSIEKEFWINTVHIDGKTNLNATSTHPAEKPPANSTIPTGGGFKLTEPNNVGDWEFRSFTFAPDQIVVNQGDKVTLHFIGVQGAFHDIEVKGVDTFELKRAQIHTVSFTPNSPGTITYICNVHPPNMVGQILVLPKATV